MEYRLQDFLKFIIPGMYVEAIVFGWCVLSHNACINCDNAKDYEGIILFLIPFLGYVIGYLIECIMSLIEHLFYWTGRRPSKSILKGCSLYELSTKDKILAHHDVQRNNLTNSEANGILQTAKQVIDREKVEHFRNNSMLARNIFGGQLLISIVYTVISSSLWANSLFYVLWGVSILFLIYWIHHTHVYVKYVLAEYGESLS